MATARHAVDGDEGRQGGLMRRHLAIGIITLLAVAVPFAQVPDDPLAAVKRLYESASYDEALAALGRVTDQTDAEAIDEYRALCFLGLNRTREAEQAVERLVIRHGSTTYDVTNHPPKFVTLYRSVRKRLLPIAAAALFESAKSSFEEGHYAIASGQFKDLLKLLSDPLEAAALGDLRMLADGFLRLGKQRLVDVSQPPQQAQPATNSLQALPPKRSKEEVYGLEDVDVVPPEIIDQRMPKWMPPNTSLANQMFQGTLEVIVGEDGGVKSRLMSEPAYPSYDLELLRATRQWHYKPATKEGRPVKYRKVIAVTLIP